jgi:hypothetical protein
VGLVGGIIGIHRSLALSAAAVFVVTGFLWVLSGQTRWLARKDHDGAHIA